MSGWFRLVGPVFGNKGGVPVVFGRNSDGPSDRSGFGCSITSVLHPISTSVSIGIQG